MIHTLTLSASRAYIRGAPAVCLPSQVRVRRRDTCAIGRLTSRASSGGAISRCLASAAGHGMHSPHARMHSRKKSRTAIWCFWKLDCHIKNQLFFSHKRSVRSGHKQAPTNDPRTALFGTAVPSSIPESASWWQALQMCYARANVHAHAQHLGRDDSTPIPTNKQKQRRPSRRIWPRSAPTRRWG